jgi:endogenous inhibitor of DNA gyrase (YacG/DUF329 family)
MARRTERSDRPANQAPAKRGGTCPICSTQAIEAYWPFCSRRCADLDLARWLGGAYAIPVAEADDEDGEEDVSGPPKDRDEID